MTLFVPPFLTILDENGAPVSGGYLRFFESGTLTPLPVYADAERTTSLGSIVEADGAGRLPAIYLGLSGRYRVIVADAGGTIIRDIDPVGDDLISELSGAGGADLIGTSQGSLGRRLDSLPVYARDFIPEEMLPAVMAGTNTADLASYINAAATRARDTSRFLDMGGVPSWLIKSELRLTGLPGFIAPFDMPITVDVTGSFPRGYAVEFGNPTQSGFEGRSDFLQLLGCPRLVASSRAIAINGFFLKGSFMNVGHLRAEGFNGHGVHIDTVWDSTISRVSVELCGSVTRPALLINSNGDTTNTLVIHAIQCESAYHKGVFAKLLRSRINTIHAERLSILSTNEGDGTYLNHSLELSNSSLNQAVLQARSTQDESPDNQVGPNGEELASDIPRVKLTGDGSSFNEVDASQAQVVTDFGTRVSIRNLDCGSYVQSAPADRVELHLLRTSLCRVEAGVTLVEPTIGTFDPQINGRNLRVDGGVVSQPIAFSQSVQGNIVFNNVTIGTVGETRSPNTAGGYLPVTFNTCAITRVEGAFNAKAVIRGGRVGTVALVSQAAVQFDHCEVGSFTYAGNTAFLTRGVRADTVSMWTVPANMAYPAGTITERVGYSAAGKLYQNTDGGTAWSVLA